MIGSWDMYLASPTDFAGAADIITNLEKDREPGIEIIKCAPLSLIIASNKLIIISFIYFKRAISSFQWNHTCVYQHLIT